MNVDYCKDMHKQYLIIQKMDEVNDDRKNAVDFSVKMLLNNDINGILAFELRVIDNKNLYYYDITGRLSLKQLVDNRQLNYRRISRILEQILSITLDSSEYFLELDDFVLGEDYVFWDEDKNGISLVHAPGYAVDLRDQIARLTEFLMENLNYKEEAAVLLVYKFHKICTEPDCTFSDLSNIIGERKQEVKQQEEESLERQEMERNSQVKKESEWESQERRESEWESCERQERKCSKGKESEWESQERTGQKLNVKKNRRIRGQKGHILKKQMNRVPNTGIVCEDEWRKGDKRAFQNITEGHRLFLCACLFAMSQIVGVFLYQKGYFISFVTEKWNVKVIGIYSIIVMVLLILLIYEAVQFFRMKKEEELELDKTVCVKRPQELPGNQEIIYGYLIPEVSCEEKEICIREFPCFIGKSPRNNMGICESRTVSRYHARIDKISGSYYVTDLHSTNGTYVNQKKIPTDERHEIKDQDEISFANVSYHFHLCKI